MKNIKYIVSTVIVVAVAVLIIVGCKKESYAPDNGTPTIEQDGMSAYLQNFKEKMQSGAKADETLDLEDAMWHLEAVLNYSYDNAGFQFSEIQCDTFTYTIQTMGDEMSMSQINDAFNSLSNDIETAFDKCNLTDKNVMSVHTVFEPCAKATSLSVKNVITISGGTISPYHFGPTDYWNDGFYYTGKCGPYEGEFMDSDAAKELTKKLNLQIPRPACVTTDSKSGGYYTDIVNYFWLGCDYDEFMIDDNSPCGYKLYISGPWSPDGCICPDDMNYYLNKGVEIVNHYKPEGMVVVSVYYSTWYKIPTPDEGGPNLDHGHLINISYGKFHCPNE